MLIESETKESLIQFNPEVISKSFERLGIMFIKFLTSILKIFIKLWHFFVKLCKKKIAVGYLFFVVFVLLYLSITIYKIKDQESNRANEIRKEISQQIKMLQN